jgi:hemoglobin-like flavoprotein
VLRPSGEGDEDPSVTQPDPVSDSGVHAMPEMQRDPAVLFGHKVDCDECRGRGYVIVSTRDLLRQSIGLVSDGDELVREFYRRLLDAAPGLAVLFPADLLTEDSIKKQREKLLNALTALAHLYDPDDPKNMDKLTTALKAFGRSHASFDRQDGSQRGATFDEYAAVKAALLDTLTDAAGQAWKPAYSDAWSEAYDFAAVTMLAEQYATVPAIARQPRVSANQPLRGVEQ